MTNNQDQRPSEASFLFQQLLKMKRREMKPGTRKRLKIIKGPKTWLYPWSQEREYRKYLFDLMDIYSQRTIPTMRKNLPRWVEEQRNDSIRQDQFEPEFEAFLDELQQVQFDMFNPNGNGVRDREGNQFSSTTINASLLALGISISRQNKKQWQKFTKRALGTTFNPSEPWLENGIRIWVRENYRLINSLTDDYIKNLNRIVYDGVLNGEPWNAIMTDIEKMTKNITRARPSLLARDQTGKLNGRLTKRRQQEAGVNFYRWLTSNDERVRGRPGGKYPTAKPSHWKLHNKICRWDDNSVYADSVEDALAGKWKKRSTEGMYEGIPGQDIQCRCSAIPVFADQIEGIDKQLEQEEEQKSFIVPVKKKPVKKKPVKKKPVKKKPVTSSERLKKNSKKFENKVRNDTIENAAIYDKRGNLILEKKGKSDRISFTASEQEQMKNARLLTHNHPGFIKTRAGKEHSLIVSFSDSDILRMSELNINEIRAVAKLRTRNVAYSLKTTTKKLNKSNAKKLIKFQEEQADKIAKKAISDRAKLNQFGPLPPAEVERISSLSWEKAVTEINKIEKLGLKYKRSIE